MYKMCLYAPGNHAYEGLNLLARWIWRYHFSDVHFFSLRLDRLRCATGSLRLSTFNQAFFDVTAWRDHTFITYRNARYDFGRTLSCCTYTAKRCWQWMWYFVVMITKTWSKNLCVLHLVNSNRYCQTHTSIQEGPSSKFPRTITLQFQSLELHPWISSFDAQQETSLNSTRKSPSRMISMSCLWFAERSLC